MALRLRTYRTPLSPKVPKALPQAHPMDADPSKRTGDEVAEAAARTSRQDRRARSAARTASTQNERSVSVYTLSAMQTVTERYRRALSRRVPWMPATGAGCDAAR